MYRRDGRNTVIHGAVKVPYHSIWYSSIQPVPPFSNRLLVVDEGHAPSSWRYELQVLLHRLIHLFKWYIQNQEEGVFEFHLHQLSRRELVHN